MNEETANLLQRILKIEQNIRDYLDRLGKRRFKWLSQEDPVRIKNLEKIAGHLHSILNFLESQDDKPCFIEQKTKTLCLILGQIQKPCCISSNNAWEFADMLEIELIRLGDPVYIYMLLKAQQKADNTDPHRWEKHFQSRDLYSLIDSYNCGKFDNCQHLLEARRFLEHLRQEQVSEYRRDRAKAQLRGIYLGRMALILVLILPFLSYFYIAATQWKDNLTYLLLVVLLSGAAGSVLSHALKLGKQPLHAETEEKIHEQPLGIRALISEWKVFIAQPVIGATAALVLFLIFKAGLLQIGGMKELGPEVYGLIAFLAGFSEVYFIGILEKVGGHTGS
ncbi:MAG TPA: hypothetical protein VIO58_13585 [Candidatus Methanoperedens sp.]